MDASSSLGNVLKSTRPAASEMRSARSTPIAISSPMGWAVVRAALRERENFSGLAIVAKRYPDRSIAETEAEFVGAWPFFDAPLR
jgi:hypothetical protein